MNAQTFEGQTRVNLMRWIQGGYFPILLDNALDPLFVCEVVREAGFPAVEYTLRRHDYDKLLLMKKEFPDLQLIIGSVIDQPELLRFIRSKRKFYSIEELGDLGADGIVSYLPFREQTYERFAGKMVLVPGVETAAAAFEQLALGADLIKVLGMAPNQITAMDLATHSALPIISTGVALDAVGEMIRCGAQVVATSIERTLGLEQFASFVKNPDRNLLLDRLLAYKAEIAGARRELEMAVDDIGEPGEFFKSTGRYFHGR